MIAKALLRLLPIDFFGGLQLQTIVSLKPSFNRCSRPTSPRVWHTAEKTLRNQEAQGRSTREYRLMQRALPSSVADTSFPLDLRRPRPWVSGRQSATAGQNQPARSVLLFLQARPKRSENHLPLFRLLGEISLRRLSVSFGLLRAFAFTRCLGSGGA